MRDKEVTMKRQAYNQTTLGERVQTTSRYLRRAKKHGSRQLANALLTPQTWLSLTSTRPLTNQTVYSQSVQKFTDEAKLYYGLPERNYMVIEYRH